MVQENCFSGSFAMHKVGPRPSLQCAVHVRENTLVLEIDIMASSIFPTSTHYSFDGCTSNVMILRSLHRAIFLGSQV